VYSYFSLLFFFSGSLSSSWMALEKLLRGSKRHGSRHVDSVTASRLSPLERKEKRKLPSVFFIGLFSSIRV
jgi:hypothetical protein